MYFTDEEKEIIKYIANKGSYSISSFFDDNFKNREVIKIEKEFQPTPNGWDFFPKLANFRISSETSAKVFEIEYTILLVNFIKIWNILKSINLVVDKSISPDKIKENFTNFATNNEISLELCIEYETYCTKEMLVIKNQLKEFISNGYKTQDEIHMEKALKSADKSYKVSLWIAGISIALSIYAIVKDNEVKVNNLNEIKVEKLEKQLELTNKELVEIKKLLNQKKK